MTNHSPLKMTQSLNIKDSASFQMIPRPLATYLSQSEYFLEVTP
ncbi:hypothetical protein ACQTPQ_07190 [Streptococcus hyovaginalis]